MKIEVTLTVVENESVEYTITTGGETWEDIHTIINNAEKINLRKEKPKKKGKRLPGFIQGKEK
jgi:hypothetical protein